MFQLLHGLGATLGLVVVTLAAPFPAGIPNSKRWGSGTYVDSVSKCPALTPRASPPTSVHDLRPDDFSYTIAVGDSISAGAFAMGLQSDTSTSMSEWRGLSYAAGADDGALTIPNLIKHYNPSVTGGSKGRNGFPEICFGIICPPGSLGWNAEVDQLNAAQTGALASNLLHEVNDYLIPQVKKRNIPAESFKYINLQIGSNDQCWLCAQATLGFGPGSPDDFETNVRKTLEALRTAIPNSLVNLIGVFKISDIFELTVDQPYCSKIIPHENWECACSFLGGAIGEATRGQMDKLQQAYNDRLIKIATDYQTARYPDFAVAWQPSSAIDLGSYPIEALSDVDCYHPSLKAHELLASGIWNNLVQSAEGKLEAMAWSTTPSIRCLEDGDRIPTDTLL